MQIYLQPFCEIMQLTDVQEGIIVRCIQQLNEILRDVKNAAHLIGDPVLKQKMQEASDAIKRDIVFTGSLYTSEDNPKLKHILEDSKDERLLPVGDE
jgi:antiviral helicase SKI2